MIYDGVIINIAIKHKHEMAVEIRLDRTRTKMPTRIFTHNMGLYLSELLQ
jgi:hypothetical protein